MKPWRLTPEMIRRYTALGYWGTETILDLWARNAREFPDREALVDSRRRLTWSQANLYIDRLALGFLEAGLSKDQVVLTQLPNIAEAVLVNLALEKAGLLRLPLMMSLRAAEVEALARRVQAVGAVFLPRAGERDYYQMLKELQPVLFALRHLWAVGDDVPLDCGSIAEMMERPLEKRYSPSYLKKTQTKANELMGLATTSGTTGLPKVAGHTNNTLLMSQSFANVHRWQIGEQDVMAALSPVVGGPCIASCWATAPVVAAKVVLLERFEDEAALELLAREKVTFAAGVPAQMALMVKHPRMERYDLSSLRIFFYGGAVCPRSLAVEIEEKMGCHILNNYGSMDCGAISSNGYNDSPEVRWDSVGKPYPGNEIRLVDDGGRDVAPGEVGEVTYRGPTCGPGYFDDNQAILEAWGGKRDGWYSVGDLGKFDEHGNLYLVGRKKDVIIRGGQNIYPAEIESLLVSHPKVVDVALVPIPDPIAGERACACVIVRPGEVLSFDEMVHFLRQKHVASYKLPERLELMERFPTSGDGQKILKRALSDDVVRRLQE